MPHLSGAKLAIDLRRDLYFERIRNSLGYFTHANGFAAADIHWQAIELIRFRDEEVSPCNILNE